MKATIQFLFVLGIFSLSVVSTKAQLEPVTAKERLRFQQIEELLLPEYLANVSFFDRLSGKLVESPVQDEAARRLIAQFRDASDLTTKRILAMQISNNYAAKMLLKNEFKDVGRQYFTMWFGDDGLANYIIRRTQAKLSGRNFPPEVVDRIRVIQNQSSLLEMSAPMDLDAGVIADSADESRKILRQLGGPGKARQFEEALQSALEESYNEVYGTLGGSGRLNPKRAFITGTTPWHPEAYLDRKVLQGGVAGKDLIQQTADVTKQKVKEMQKLNKEGVLTLEEAMTEAMRGTAKDLKKVDAVFNRLEKITGVRPKFSAEQEAIATVMQKVRNMEMSAAVANEEILRISGGRLTAFTACDNLIDTMEGAWRLRRIKPQERLLWLFAELLDDAQYGKALKASLEEAGVFASDAKRIIDELAGAGKARTLSINGGTIDEFLDDLVRDFPTTKISTARGSETLKELIKEIEAGTSVDDLVTVLGKEKADQLAKIRGYMTAKVKAQMKLRYSRNKFLIWEVDQKSRQVLFGDTGRVALGVDAGIGIAMAFYQTASILERTDLSPEQESRLILNAWGTALPIVGDIAMGLIEGTEGYFEGDKGKIGKGLIWLTIGASGFVPALQVPALIAGLTMAGVEAGSGYFDIRKDKELLAAWLASGQWDEKKGFLLALLDSSDNPHEVSYDGIIRNGMVWYKSGLEGISIRDSIYLYLERHGLDSNEAFQSYLRGLKELYPDFEFEKALREPLSKGKELFGAVIAQSEPVPDRSVQMLMFVRAKIIIDFEANKAAQAIQAQVEAEYQARYRVGDAARIFEELRKVGERLGLPLEKNVNDLFNSFSNFVIQLAKNPWVRESIARRRVEHAEKYLNGYLEVEKSLTAIRRVFDKAGVPPPKFNLTGFLEIDGPRMKDLDAAYTNKAIRETSMDVQKLHREITGDPAYVFNTNTPDACDVELFKQLASIRVRQVEAEDRKLLFEQWRGKSSATLKSRDESLRKAQEAVDAAKSQVNVVKAQPVTPPQTKVDAAKSDKKAEDVKANQTITNRAQNAIAAGIEGFQSVVTVPPAVWNGLCENYEAAYAWTTATIEGTGEAYDEAIQVQTERIERFKAEYSRTLEAGRKPMQECVTVVPSARIEVDKIEPAKGDTVTSRVVFTRGKTPSGGEWTWTSSGGLTLAQTSGESVGLKAESNGTVTAVLRLGGKELTRVTSAISVRKGPNTEPSPSPETPGSVKLTAKAEVLAAELLDVKAIIPPDLRSKAKKADWYPEGCSGTPSIDSAKLSFRNPRDGKPGNEYISYVLRDANNEKIGEASATILVRPVLFGGSAPGIWTASSGPAGVAVERQPAIRKFQDKDSGVVRAKVEVLWADSFAPKTLQEIEAEMTKAKGGNDGLSLTPVTIAGFKGLLLERKEIKQGATGSGYVDLGLPDTELGGWGYAIKDCIVIKFSYTAFGGGVIRGESWAIWWNDLPFIRSQTRAAATEAKSVLTGLTLGPDGKFTKTPYKGPKLDGSDTPTVKLVFSPNKKKLRKGEVINVQAVIENEENAEKPFKYDWSGDHAGSGPNVQFLATQPGKQRLGVVVPNIGGAAVEFEVEDLKAVIKQVTPTSPKIMVGTPATFSAQLLSGGQPSSGSYIYRWQPTPDVKFDPAEGPANQAKAIFSRPGRQKVFVQVLEKKGEILQTLAESEQIEIEIIKPDFKITFSPPISTVGKEVKAKVDVIPADLKDIDFRWEVTPNGKQTLESQDKREITIILQDTKPVTVTAHARVPFTGDDLGKQTATITAAKLDVKAIVLGAEPPKPQVWKEGVGLVPLETGIAVGQFVGLRAEVTPAQEGLRYEWSLSEDSHFAGNSMSQQIRVSRSQTGTCEAAVIVRDKNGIELGRAAATFDVTVSQADVNNAKARANAAAKVVQAKELITKGKLDEAIALAGEARGLDPKNTEAAALGSKWNGDRTTIQNQLSKVRGLMDQGKFPDANQELAVAKKLHPLYQPVINAETELAGRTARSDSAKRESIAQVKRGNDLYEKGENAAAISAYGQALQADPTSAAAYAGRCLAKRNANDATAVNDCDSALRIDPKNATAYRGRSYIKRANNDLPGALADAEQAISLAPNDYGGHLARGLVKAAMNDSSGAMADYDRAIRLNPNYPMTYYNRGIAKLNLKNNQGALADFNQFLTMRPTYSSGYNNRGIANERLGNTALALADYQKALDLDPNNATAKANLARLKGTVTPPVLPPVEPSATSTLPLDLTPLGGKKGTIKKVRNIDYDDATWIRLKSTDERRLNLTIPVNRISAKAVAVVSSLDDGHFLDQGKTIAKMTVITTDGRHVYEIKAGIHSADWGGPESKHLRDIPAAISKNPYVFMAVFDLPRKEVVTSIVFDYVETNAPRNAGHAPGFILKGISMLGADAGGTVGPPAVANFLPLDLTQIGGKKGQPHYVNGIPVDDGSYIRLKSTDEKRLTYTIQIPGSFNATSVAIVSQLDDAIHLTDGMTITRMTVIKNTGEERFDIKAGVHSSEWNRSDGPKHKAAEPLQIFKLARPGSVSAVRFDYVVNNVEKWWGHAPGFVLKGATLVGGVTGAVDTKPPSATPKPTPVPATPRPTPTPASKVVELLSSMNSGVVSNSPTGQAQFDTNRPYMIASIMTYHWNNGRGTSRPGTISIRASNGKVYGPYSAVGLPAGSVANAFWEVKPNVVLPPGNYVIVDSDPTTWSHNSQSGGRGFTTIRGYLVTYPAVGAILWPVRLPPNFNQLLREFVLFDRPEDKVGNEHSMPLILVHPEVQR